MGLDVIRQIDRLDEKVGGRFRLTALIQKRIQEVTKGSPRLIDGKTPMRSALAEIEAGKIELSEQPAAPAQE
jgi:DNA-directed RNA polymerase subunit K/omega